MNIATEERDAHPPGRCVRGHGHSYHRELSILAPRIVGIQAEKSETVRQLWP